MRMVLSALLGCTIACGGGGDTGTGTGSPPPGQNPGPPAPAPVATQAVDILGSDFNPENIVVPPSSQVTFTNSDGFAHNVTFDNTAVTSVASFTTGTRTVTMPATIATYAYRCTLHAGMTGTVKVQ